MIETWSKGEKIEDDNNKEKKDDMTLDVESNSINIVSEVSRGGNKKNIWGKIAEKPKSISNSAHGELISRVRSRARSFLFEIYSVVN